MFQNQISFFCLALIFQATIACHGQNQPLPENSKTMHAHTNALIQESSPYLLQHAHNPVNWNAWSNATLEKAKAENKMLIISVGYSSCHWCHVMEKESFEDLEVAKIMNEHFIAIKVDREERPDIDQVYMDAAYAINGSGGWPLNALALPNGKSFFAGTYFNKSNWIKVLNYFVELKKNQPQTLEAEAEKLTQGMSRFDRNDFKENALNIDLEKLSKAFNNLYNATDLNQGGFARAPKFPMPSVWEFLLQYFFYTQNNKALKAVEITLTNMMQGGIYDQVGGGFARYSTDMNWRVPHFEKMLYDNAQLVSLYTHAYQVTGNNEYRQVVYETLEFIQREMTSPEGVFYSAIDADSEGEEGKYYVWKYEEIEKNLNDETAIFAQYYHIRKDGNWEHKNNILYRSNSLVDFAVKHKLNPEEFKTQVEKNKATLLQVRNQRTKPLLDDKSLTAWNALMISAYCHAYLAFGENRFLNAALKCANYMQENFKNKNGQWWHTYKNGNAKISAFADDYAFLIAAFIDLYHATYNEQWLHEARQIAEVALQFFYDEKSGLFFYTSSQQEILVSRKMEIADNVIPSSNSAMAKGLFFLGNYFPDSNYSDLAQRMISQVQEEIINNNGYYSNWASLSLLYTSAPFEVAIVGENFKEVSKVFQQKYLPNALIMACPENSSLSLLQNKGIPRQTTIYVCQNKTCKLPVTDFKKAFELMNIK